MSEQLVMRLKGKSWGLILPLIAVLALAACGPTPAPAPATVEIEKEVTKEVPKETPAAEERKVVRLELADVIETLVPVEVENRQPLQLSVVDTGTGRLHFRLEIDADDYPPGNDFKLEVMAIPSETIAKICWDQEVCKEYPEVSDVTEDGRLIILVDSGEYSGTEYVTANPYAFSVTGIDRFENPVSVSISVDIPPEEISEAHGIIIHHKDDGTTERFPAELIEEGDFFRVINSDSITRCCSCYGHCSSGPACLKCGK